MERSNRKKRKKRSRIRQFLPYLAIILIAACLIVAVILVTGRRGIEGRVPPSVVELDNPSESEQQDERMRREADPKITALVQRYFEAAAKADADTLNQIVESDTAFQEDRLKAEAEFTESYNNIVCYTIPGIVENTYITYVCYEIKLIGIKTSAPSLVCFYICQDENGSMYINRRKQDGEVAAYMEQVANWPEVRELKNEVNTRYQEACAADDDLRRLRDMLDGNDTGESSSAGEETTGTAQE